MIATALRRAYLDFFKTPWHAEIGSASLIPQNDPRCCSPTAGMHPLVRSCWRPEHPAGKRLRQLSEVRVRTGDIEEVGDSTPS